MCAERAAEGAPPPPEEEEEETWLEAPPAAPTPAVPAPTAVVVVEAVFVFAKLTSNSVCLNAIGVLSLILCASLSNSNRFVDVTCTFLSAIGRYRGGVF